MAGQWNNLFLALAKSNLFYSSLSVAALAASQNVPGSNNEKNGNLKKTMGCMCLGKEDGICRTKGCQRTERNLKPTGKFPGSLGLSLPRSSVYATEPTGGGKGKLQHSSMLLLYTLGRDYGSQE